MGMVCVECPLGREKERARIERDREKGGGGEPKRH
jgi:hypothetical protein